MDTRPLFSIPPERAQRLGQDLADVLKLGLDETFSAIASLPGDPAERENDALSMVSGLAAMIGVQLVGRMMKAKHVGLDAAMRLAIVDIEFRLRGTIDFATSRDGAA